MNIILIRHGKTQGNIEGRYIGTTDEDLSLIGIKEIKSIEYPYADIIISSPLKRCIQTAELIYKKEIEIFEDLKECDFGDFENKNYEELKNNNDYVIWLESNGKMTFPNGESYDEFCKRCCRCFEKVINKYIEKNIAFVVHGGTIMAILEKYSHNKSFYDWQIKNGEYLCFTVVKNKSDINLKILNM